ncbi:DoxX family protein [Bradyrhizobium sp. CCGUVB14]|uniref:DoxX family protein n=1 Tax=Bradyrhizobium sp. CCGUVB14 TaxID=2949628 RepID=UPI0035BF03E5
MRLCRGATTISNFVSALRSIVTWIARIALCLTSGVSGAVELAVDPASLLTADTMWSTGSPLWLVRSVGAAELAGAIGIAAAVLTGSAPRLIVLSAAGLFAIELMALGICSRWSALATPAPLDQLSLALSLVVFCTTSASSLRPQRKPRVQPSSRSYLDMSP